MDDEIKRIHKEGGGKKEEEGSKRDNNSNGDDAGEGEKREGDSSLEYAYEYDEIYGAIASGHGNNTTNAKDDAKDNNDGEWRMVGIPKLWVCAMVHTKAVAELITERDIDCLEHLNYIPCRDFEGGIGLKLRFTFNIKTNEYFTNVLLIKRYELPNLLLDDEPIIKKVTGWK